MALEASRQFGAHHGLLVAREGEEGVDAVVRLTLKCLYLALALHDESHGDALHAPSAQALFHLGPQKRADLITHKPVKDAACLLCIYQVGVYVTRGLYGVQYGVLAGR